MKCLYSLLEVDLDASPVDIKKSYKRLALKLHPDRNSIEKAEIFTQRFAELQKAFEVLSDATERAWYDNHRVSLIMGAQRTVPGKNSTSQGPVLSHLVDIMSYFNPSIYSNYNDHENGFFTVFGKLFEAIKKEDELYFTTEKKQEMGTQFGRVNCLYYPSFGNSTLEYMNGVKSFYDFWEGYSTAKTFSWCDIYDTRHAPNQLNRRHYQKENNKVREAKRKEYNMGLRELVNWIRRRDTRVKRHIKLINARKEEAKAQRQAKLDSIKHTQSNINLDQLVQGTPNSGTGQFAEQKWTRVDYSDYFDKVEQEYERDYKQKDVNSAEEDLLFCIACERQFYQEHTFMIHNNSVAHLDKVDALRIELESEDHVQYFKEPEILLNIVQSEINNKEEEDQEAMRHFKKKEKVKTAKFALSLMSSNNLNDSDTFGIAKTKTGKEEEKDPLIEQLASLIINKGGKGCSDSTLLTETDAWDNPASKITNKKKKKAKKGAEASIEGNSNLLFSCQVCSKKYKSKNKLFQHIDEKNHAAVKNQTKGKAKM